MRSLVFSGNPLRRPGSEHHDAAWFEQQREHPGARYLPLHNLQALAIEDSSPRLAWRDASALRQAEEGAAVVLLGTADGVPHFAVAVTDLPNLAPGERFEEARGLAAVLSHEEASILGQARSLVDWHARHPFCARCGAPTEPVEAGARRRCTRCDARHYPRVDPSIIVLVEHEGRALLGQRASAAGKRRSCLAGFIEPGESIEEAVVREVREEAGVEVEDVTYRYSQPWPFPSALMIGCRARATSDWVQVDGIEIASAEWFDRAEALAAIEGRSEVLEVPPPTTIAHHLIRDWATGDEATGGRP